MEFPVANIEEIETLTTYAGEYSSYFEWKGTSTGRLTYSAWGVQLGLKSVQHWILLTLRDYPGDNAYIELAIQIDHGASARTLILDKAPLAEEDGVERFRFKIGCLCFALQRAAEFYPEKKTK